MRAILNGVLTHKKMSQKGASVVSFGFFNIICHTFAVLKKPEWDFYPVKDSYDQWQQVKKSIYDHFYAFHHPINKKVNFLWYPINRDILETNYLQREVYSASF